GYYVKKNKLYFLPESGVAMLVGVLIGGIARLTVTDLTLFSFSPEFFFFVLLPPIIFEAGYSLEKKHFFENIGAITLYAFWGTIISAFVVGMLTYWSAQIGLIGHIDKNNPMEALLFGALISAVDPVATLSIMGSPELKCDNLLYSLVFGESVLNDAVAIVLFKTFHTYYDPEGPEFNSSVIPHALFSFVSMTVLSILVGLLVSYIYKHTSLSDFPKLEGGLLFLFCYCCYATAEAVQLSGIMALFFNGIILSHYNSYNLSNSAQVTTEQFFATLATIMETIVFLYMGLSVFTRSFKNWDLMFALLGLLFCLVARALNIFPISFLANCCRRKGENKISLKMQCVLWFAGLRGAIAFALSMNMPGPNADTYAAGTLFICMFTTIVCGGFTEKIL
ncbi:sodium/hydrogen exchanger, Na+/H+ exchanger, antiporter, partial [Thalassiosira pseudonana CCMP1335]